MMKYQDIHTTDLALWKQYQDNMAKGEYDVAKAILAQTQLDNKRIDASLFNDITTELTRLQNQGKDSTWSKNVMQIMSFPPSAYSMKDGECGCYITKAFTPHYVTIIGLDDIPSVLAQSSGSDTPKMTKVISMDMRLNDTPITKDGVYEIYNEHLYFHQPTMYQVYTKYGVRQTISTGFYLRNNRIFGQSVTLSDWDVDENANTYQFTGNFVYSDGSVYTQAFSGLQYSPFSIQLIEAQKVSALGRFNFFRRNTTVKFSYEIKSDGAMNTRIDVT